MDIKIKRTISPTEADPACKSLAEAIGSLGGSIWAEIEKDETFPYYCIRARQISGFSEVFGEEIKEIHLFESLRPNKKGLFLEMYLPGENLIGGGVQEGLRYSPRVAGSRKLSSMEAGEIRTALLEIIEEASQKRIEEISRAVAFITKDEEAIRRFLNE